LLRMNIIVKLPCQLDIVKACLFVVMYVLALQKQSFFSD